MGEGAVEERGAHVYLERIHSAYLICSHLLRVWDGVCRRKIALSERTRVPAGSV